MDDLQNLEHVLWVAEHVAEYQFAGKSERIREDLVKYAASVNTYYTDLKDTYREFVAAFENNATEYQIAILGRGKDKITTSYTDHYLIEWEEGGESYHLPLAYLVQTRRQVEPGRLAAWRDAGWKECEKILSEVRKSAREACRKASMDAEAMEMVLPAYQKDNRKDFLVLALTGTFLLSIARFHPLVQSLSRRLSKGQAFWKAFSTVMTQKATTTESMTALMLLLASVWLVRLIFVYTKKTIICSQMSYLVGYKKELDELLVAEGELEKNLLTNPLGRELEKKPFTWELERLFHLSAEPVTFRFFKGISGENCWAYGARLRSHAYWILVILLVTFLLVG